MTYAYVENGVVVRTGDIPSSWRLADGRSISGFNLRPDLWATEGWLPIVEVRASFDPATQQLGPPVYAVGATEVTATYLAVPLPVETLNSNTITSNLEARLVGLQAIIDRPNVTLSDNNTATIRQALRDLQVEVRTLARVDRQQTRKLLGLLDGTD